MKSHFRLSMSGIHRRFDQVSKQATREVALYYDHAMFRAQYDKVWNWTGETRRKSGEIAGSPRNIVDLGTHINSERVNGSFSPVANESFSASIGNYPQPQKTSTGYGYTFSWTAPHSSFVAHGTKRYRGRPWWRLAQAQGDIAGQFKRSLSSREKVVG